MKPLHWIASSKDDVKDFPHDVRREVGFALHLAQLGDKHLGAVPMLGFGSAKVLEVVIDDDGDAYRAVYTVKFAKAVYVLHAFQKKSKRGIETPKLDIEKIKSRLKLAEQHYKLVYEHQEKAHDRGA
jgi:phage-related protein